MRIPKLDLARRVAPQPAAPRAVACAPRDPLTGHRGEAGESLVVDLGPATLIARLTSGASGPVLRGQLSAPDPRRLAGALVHARGSDGVALAAADGIGEFAVKGWQGRLEAVEVELEDGTWSVRWPAGEA